MTITKLCPGCGENKDLSKYHKDKSKKHGVASLCKICRVPDCKKYYIENKERIKINYRKWRKTDNGKRSSLKGNKKYNAKFPKRYAAERFIFLCVSKGTLLPASAKVCEHCGKQAQHYHHWNGYEPINYLEIIPLCMPCHRAVHAVPIPA